MATKPNFSALLSKPMSEVEKPKPYPVGTYSGVIQGMPRFDKSSKKQTDFVEFTVAFQSAHDDVDQEDLANVGGIAGKTIKTTYYITENSLWRLKDFLLACGLEGDNFAELIEKTPGCAIDFTIKHEPSQDGESVFARVDKVIAQE